MGKIHLKDGTGQTLASANYGADVTVWDAIPQNDDIRIEDYANDGLIVPLEISDGRKQLEKTLNQMTVSSGGPLGLGGYGGSTKLFLKPAMLNSSAPTEIPDCYTMRVTVELEEPYRICEGSFLGMRTGCEQLLAKQEVEMWMQWKNGAIILSQYPEAPSCPTLPPAPPAPMVEPAPIAHNPLWDSLLQFFDRPVAAAFQSLFRLFG